VNHRIDQVWPWGRTLEEYRRMFALGDADLTDAPILGCADGPASFNAELTRRGGRVVSCDPLYQFSADEIRRRIDVSAPEILESTRRRAEHFVWTSIPSVERLGELRMGAMREFLKDYGAESGRQGRYVNAALPRLPFKDGAFGLALSSHFLFLYSAEFSLDFHEAAALEMLRVARRARIFPLITMDDRPSPHVAPLVERLAARGVLARVAPVDYEFQRGGDQCLFLERG
jgi:hypothetical protein